MRILIEKNYELLSKKATDYFKNLIVKGDVKTVAFPTGLTPLNFYKELVRLYKEKEIDFSNITGFLIDEYYPISNNSKDSFRYYIDNNFFKHINIKKKYYYNGENKNFLEECALYEENIIKEEGLDLAISGIGNNGHIGFNEPGSDFNSRVRLVELEAETAKINKEKYESENTPKYALTLGILNIMQSKKILLLASGLDKSFVVKKIVEGEITRTLPSSVLRLHRDLTIILDEQAASKLDEVIKEIIQFL